MRKGYKQFHIHVPQDIAKKVKMIAAFEGTTLTELLTEVLIKVVASEKYKKALDAGGVERKET